MPRSESCRSKLRSKLSASNSELAKGPCSRHESYAERPMMSNAAALIGPNACSSRSRRCKLRGTTMHTSAARDSSYKRVRTTASFKRDQKSKLGRRAPNRSIGEPIQRSRSTAM